MMFVDENLARTSGSPPPIDCPLELPPFIYVGVPEFIPFAARAQQLARQAERALRAVGGPVSNSVDPHRNRPQVGRNDPCPCGSGKKYKRCCKGG